MKEALTPSLVADYREPTLGTQLNPLFVCINTTFLNDLTKRDNYWDYLRDVYLRFDLTWRDEDKLADNWVDMRMWINVTNETTNETEFLSHLWYEYFYAPLGQDAYCEEPAPPPPPIFQHGDEKGN